MRWLTNFLSSGAEFVSDMWLDLKDSVDDVWEDVKSGDFASVLGALFIVGVVLFIVAVIGVGIYLFVASLTAPTKGYVHDRDHDPAYTTTQCQTINKTTTCYPVFHPESWSFDLYDGSNHGWRDVSESDYDRYQVGSYYPG